MYRRIKNRSSLAIAAALVCLAAAPGQALADESGIDTTACSAHPLSQPFISGPDFNWYAYAPGMSAAGFDPTGWTLSAGAKVAQVKINGVIGGVLNLPNGASAVSPAMCVSTDYQLVRAQIQNLTAESSGDVGVSVAYERADGWSDPQPVGKFGSKTKEWELASTVKLTPADVPGWQRVRFTLTSATSGKGFQLRQMALQAGSKLALNSVDTSACAKHELTQALMAGKDFNWYAMAPGQTAGSFDGTGWTLSGGAKLVQTITANGRTGSVLNLPSKAKAVSPLMCVSSDYRQARAQIRSLTDGSLGGVSLAAEIMGTTSWNNPKTSNLGGTSTEWKLSGTADLQPAEASGWQLVQLTLTSTTSGKGVQVYDLAARATTELALSYIDTSACSQHGLSQPFLAGGDSSWYAMAPGVSTDVFAATGWTLSGGAKLAQEELGDGALGAVLDLPAGSSAVSPYMCVNADFEVARAQIRNIAGKSGAITFASSVRGTTTWNNAKTTNLSTASTTWGLSSVAKIEPAAASAWQLVQFTLTNDNSSGEVQLYNLAAQASPSLALASVDTSACAPPPLTQVFLWAGDSLWYTPAPGLSSIGFEGIGWTLRGGASIVQTLLPNGSVGPALDLPPGSQAVAPVMCVTVEYPLARAHMRPVVGDGGVELAVAYKGTTTWNNPEKSAEIKGPKDNWGLSGKASIEPGKDPGWQLVQMTLTAKEKEHAQVYDFQVDPRMR